MEEAARLLLANPERSDGPFELVSYGSGGPRGGLDIDRTGALLAAEDQARYGGGIDEK